MNSPKFFALLCAAILAGAGLSGCCSRFNGSTGSFKKPIGLQLYSLRGSFAKDVPGTMAQVHDYGIKYVELAGTYNLPTPKFLAMLDEHGLKAVSGHFPYDRFKKEPEVVAKEAKALGLKYAGCAWISHQAPFDEKQCREAAAVFNKAGEEMAKVGIKFFYHTHGYEFQPHQNGTLFDLLLAETKPDLVAYEMDVFWIVHPGQDPVKLLKKYGSRFQLMHVKDMRAGTEHNLSGKSNVNNDVAIGTGIMDWPAILAAAKEAGVKWYFIEDESDEAARNIPVSMKYLRAVKF